MKATQVGVVLLGIGLLGEIACSSESYEPTPAKPEPAMPAMSGKKPLAMRNCPSAVPGAITRARATADGVELTVTAADPKARHEIVSRAERHAEFQVRRGLAPQHSGLHGGPESIGYCPIIHTDTTLVTNAIPEGVRITMTGRTPAAIKLLQKSVEERVRALTQPSS